MRTMATALAAAVATVCLAGGGAMAAPQILALASTPGPVALACDGATCSARFTSYCLQPGRAAPHGGHRYTLAADAGLEVIGTGADGREIDLVPETVRIHAGENQVTVTLSVPRAALDRRGLDAVAVRVRAAATLVPEAVAGDPLPQTAADIALASTVLRTLGEHLVDDDTVRMTAARETLRLVNLLPHGRMDAATARRTLDGVLTPARLAALPAAARPFVADARDYCALVAGNDVTTTLRQCLQGEHDSLMFYLNQGYWDALEGGS